MGIHFETSRWDTIAQNAEEFWNRTLGRPLYKYIISDAYTPDRPKPDNPILTQKNVHDFSISPEEIIDAWDYHLSCCEFLGDSYPYVSFDVFGPGLLTAFCGATLDNSSGHVWFFPPEKKELSEISFHYDPENLWAKRVKDIYRAGMKKWQGKVLMSTPDLGGNFDSVAVMRGTENLLYDLYDEPDEVIRVLKEADQAWFDAFADINTILHPEDGSAENPGYSDWDGIFSKTPSYILQSDFSYNISTDMFQEFTMPRLKFFMDRLEHTIYHLDGIGQINHLPILLQNEKLNAVQWVFGDGQKPAPFWIDLYRQIEDSGKGNQIIGSPTDFETVEREVKKNLYYTNHWADQSMEYYEKHKKSIDRYLI